MAERSTITSDEMKLLYQITVSDLSYFKTQQWSLTNYGFLLLAGLVAVWQSVKSNATFVERWILIALAVLVAIAVLFILRKLQRSISVRQARLDAAREGLSVHFYEAWSAETKPKEYIHAITLLRSAVVIAACIVCWLILRS